METFLLNLLKTSLLGSLAILAMLVLKPLWRERYRAKTRCWLWLALAVFLLLPVDFSVKNAPVQAAPPKDYTLFVGTDKTAIQSTDNLFGDMAERSGQSPAAVRDTIIQRPVTNPEQKTTRYIPVTMILFYGYLAGAAAFLLYQGVSYALFRRTVRRWKRDVSRADYASLLSDTARDLGVSAPEMIVCEAISTPAVTGLLRPRLLLPHERYDVQELRYILRHELCHLKRRDMLLKLVLLAANAMHWFNPVVYLMLRQADEDIELACDSAATDGLELPERAAYSRTLLAAVQSSVRALPATTCFGGTVERLKRRITNVLGAQKKRGLGIVALVLALTLTAGCAVSWGERAQKNDDPFADKSYTVDTLLYEAPGFTDGFTDGAYPTFRTATNPAGEKYVTMFNDLGYALIYGPMEEYKLEKQSFYALFGNTRDASPVDDLMQHNKSAWTGYCEEAKDSQPYQAYLLEQEDGTIYLGLSADYAEDGSECFCMVYRLNEQINPIYASMDDYAAACVEDLKKGTMTYSVSENNDYASRSIEDTVADVRVTQLEQADSLGNLSPDGTVLELWYFQYEMKPTNEADMQIDVIGGQELTDDGYLNEHWTHYLTVLHYTSGEQTGYQILGTSMSNDGLWYNGCGYGVDLKYYLHDFYVDYAGLDLPKMYIPDLVDGLVEDGYGHGNSVEGRLISGNGNYSFYAPISGWTYKPDAEYAEYWCSSYNTGSYFSVTEVDHSLYDEKPEWESAGYTAEWVGESCRFVTHEGMSNTVVTLFNGPNNTCYIVEIHWLFDGSTEENQWGWNHDRAVEEEAVILQAMVNSFRASKILFTDGSSNGSESSDSAPDDTAFQADLQLASNGGASWLSLNTDGMAVGGHDPKDAAPTVLLDTCDYKEYDPSESSPSGSAVPPRGGNPLALCLSLSNSARFTFYEGSDFMLYQHGDTRYYKVSSYGDYATIFDAMLAWYNKTPDKEATFESDLVLASNAATVDILAFCPAGGESGSHAPLLTGYSVALDSYEYKPIDKPKNLDGLDSVELWPHNAQATCLIFYKGTNTVKYVSGKSERYYRAVGDFSIVDNDGRTLYDLMRVWYDTAEYSDMLTSDVRAQSKSFSWQEAAQNWANAYYGTQKEVTSGSIYKFTWLNVTVNPAEETTQAKRKAGEIDDNTYCFAVRVEFTAESANALQSAMAGNTVKCENPAAPKDAYEFYRCCTIQLRDDGRWYGTELGTGW
ncbi:MAG: M56 family metallopeptidase [Oscillospiraceae bacterium]|nr:M56 family metallopeptidase [Oscillospiraceae bacterium]